MALSSVFPVSPDAVSPVCPGCNCLYPDDVARVRHWSKANLWGKSEREMLANLKKPHAATEGGIPPTLVIPPPPLPAAAPQQPPPVQKEITQPLPTPIALQITDAVTAAVTAHVDDLMAELRQQVDAATTTQAWLQGIQRGGVVIPTWLAVLLGAQQAMVLVYLLWTAASMAAQSAASGPLGPWLTLAAGAWKSGWTFPLFVAAGVVVWHPGARRQAQRMALWGSLALTAGAASALLIVLAKTALTAPWGR